MIKFILFLFFLLFSCAYPDIDSVPNFIEINITEDEAMDLCKINNSDNELVSKCLNELITKCN